MDVLSLIGVILAFVAILGGNYLEGGNAGALLNGPAALIVIGFSGVPLSVSDIEQEIKEIYQFELSTSAISRVTERVIEDTIAW